MDTEIGNIKNILLVEDDPRDVELTLTALAEHNLANKVLVVHDGAEALDYLYCRGKFQNRPGGHPIVVLLDIKMPKVNGLEVLKTIKAHAGLKTIPVVVLSSSRETPDLLECYKHGVNAYVVKPVDFVEFMKAVQQLGIFWAAINEPPPQPEREETPLPGGQAIPPGKAATDQPWMEGRVPIHRDPPHVGSAILVPRPVPDGGQRIPRSEKAPCAPEPPRASSPSPPQTCGGEGWGEEAPTRFLGRTARPAFPVSPKTNALGKGGRP
jgi:CheY-like chemotaxis protein